MSYARRYVNRFYDEKEENKLANTRAVHWTPTKRCVNVKIYSYESARGPSVMYISFIYGSRKFTMRDFPFDTLGLKKLIW